MEDRICLDCAVTFQVPSNGAGRLRKYCSVKCKDHHWRSLNFPKAAPTEVSCVECGARFTQGRPDHVICSPACSSRRHRRSKAMGSSTHGLPVRRCAQCNDVITSVRPQTKFCSKNCASLNFHYRHYNKKPRIGRTCPMCDAGIDSSRHPNAVYCSVPCRQAARIVVSYGMTCAEYRRLREAQGGACAICAAAANDLWTNRHTVRDGFHIDHDHATGKVRGILCPSCNLMLGYAKDDPHVLERAAAYLAAHQLA